MATLLLCATCVGLLQWSRLPTEMGTPPRPRVEMAVAGFGDGIVVHGGRLLGSQTALLDDLFLYNVTTSTWRHLPQPAVRPLARARHTIVVSFNQVYQGPVVYLFGGDTLTGFSDELWVLEVSHGIWRSLEAPLHPYPRVGHSMTMIGSTLYVMSGAGLTGILSDVWSLDTNDPVVRWKRQADLPAPRVDAAACASTVNGTAMVVFYGGRSDSQSAPGNNLWMLSPTSPAWNDISSPHGPSRSGHTTICYQQSLFVIAGSTPTGLVNSFWSFDFTTGVWVQRQLFAKDLKGNTVSEPSKREGGKAVIVGSNIILYGGWSNSVANGAMNDLWSLDLPGINHWVLLHDTMVAPPPLSGHCTISFADTMIVVGGRTHPSSLSWYVHEFNVTTNIWRDITPTSGVAFPAMEHHACTLFGSLLVIFGGQPETGPPTNTMYAMSLLPRLKGAREWLRINPADGPVPKVRSGHCTVVHEHSLYVFGGKGDTSIIYHDMWKYDFLTGEWAEINVAVTGSVYCASTLTYGRYHGVQQPAWFIESGQDSSENPVDENYVFLFGSERLLPIRLTLPTGEVLISDYHVSQSAAIGLGRMALLFFGQSHHRITSSIVSVDTETGIFKELHANLYANSVWPVPHAFTGAGVVAGKILLFGGVAGIGTSPLPYHFSNDMWLLKLNNDGQICPGNSACLGCLPGTEARSGECVPCPRGTYSEAGNICLPCPTGTYSDFIAAAGRYACASCPHGTYAQEVGSYACTPCPPGHYCTVHASTPQKNRLSYEIMESSQPGPYSMRSFENAPLLVFLVPGIFVITSCLMLFCGLLAAQAGRVSRRETVMDTERMDVLVEIFNRYNYDYVGLCESQLTLALREYGLERPSASFARNCLLEYDSSGNFRLEKDEWLWLCVDLEFDRKEAARLGDRMPNGMEEPPSTFQMSDVDMFPTSHRSLEMGEPPIMKTTTAGGLVSILCFVGFVVVIACLTIQHVYNNDEEIRSVLPEIIAPGAQNQSQSAEILVSLMVKGHISQSVCASPNHTCIGDVGYVISGISCQMWNLSCEFIKSSSNSDVGDCYLRSVCQGAVFNQSYTDMHSIQLGLRGKVDAEGVMLRVGTDTGIPAESSNTSFTMVAPDMKLLRGTRPNVLLVDTYPSVFVKDGDVSGHGMLVQAASYDLGSTVTDYDYHMHDGVQGIVKFNLLRASTIVVERRKIIPLLTFLASMSGTISAWMGLCAVFVYVGDLLTAYLLKKKAKKLEESLLKNEEKDSAVTTSAVLGAFDDPARPEWNTCVRPLVGASFKLCQAQAILEIMTSFTGKAVCEAKSQQDNEEGGMVPASSGGTTLDVEFETEFEEDGDNKSHSPKGDAPNYHNLEDMSSRVANTERWMSSQMAQSQQLHATLSSLMTRLDGIEQNTRCTNYPNRTYNDTSPFT